MSDSLSISSRDRAFAWLLGLHGLALMVVFPLGPQEARLWHPGVRGVGALAAAFPLATVLGGLLARRARRLPCSPRSLAAVAVLGTLPCALSRDYPTLVAARVLAGAVAGVSYVAIHRAISHTAAPLVSRLAPRLVAFGMPVCILAATLLDWRFTFAPLLLGFLGVLAMKTAPGPHTAPGPTSLAEPLPAGLAATAALAFVTAAYLTILSGYLVFNAGHTEYHIPVVLLTTALLGLAAPPLVARVRSRLGPLAFFAVSLSASLLALLPLLGLREHFPAPAAVLAIAVFLVVGSTRHLALAGLLSSRITPEDQPAHQTHAHLAHHFGAALGALVAGQIITLTPRHTLAGMCSLLAASALATALAFVAGFVAYRKAAPAA